MSLRMTLAEARRRGFIKDISRIQGRRLTRSREANINALPCLPIEGATPQQVLWRKIITRWPGEAKWEYRDAVPGRKFVVDIAFPKPNHRLAIEYDGWQFHGKYKRGFQKDREKQNLLTLHGWTVLRFYYKEVRDDIDAVMSVIAATLNRLDQCN